MLNISVRDNHTVFHVLPCLTTTTTFLQAACFDFSNFLLKLCKTKLFYRRSLLEKKSTSKYGPCKFRVKFV